MSNEERESAIEALDQKLHSKKAELEAASAKREKDLAIAQAIANTAVGITAALKLGWPMAIPAIAFAIAIGAAQVIAIGGAYNAPSVSSFAPGAGGDGGGGSTSGTIAAAGGDKGGGGKTPGFQSGTGGFIPAISDFIVGEPAPEMVQLRGPIENVQMSVTPMGPTGVRPARNEGNLNITVNVPVTAIDAFHFSQLIHERIIPEIEDAIRNGIMNVERRAR